MLSTRALCELLKNDPSLTANNGELVDSVIAKLRALEERNEVLERNNRHWLHVQKSAFVKHHNSDGQHAWSLPTFIGKTFTEAIDKVCGV